MWSETWVSYLQRTIWATCEKRLRQKKVAAPAKAGSIAPVDVLLPAQNTGLGPEKTSFFQALSIPTKIAKGTIEILNDVNLIKKGEKVGASEAALLNMLGIFPFSYGLIIQQVYDFRNGIRTERFGYDHGGFESEIYSRCSKCG